MGGIKNKSSKLGKLSNKAKTLLHMPHPLSSKERADEMAQSSQSGEVNKVATLPIKPKSTLFYIVTSLVTIMLLTILAISIKLSFLRAASNEGANDTGAATLNNVEILQAGTGAKVTIEDEVLDENEYGTDDATRRTILNNNIVKYKANYNVAQTGRITFSITLPANNTIDEATIAESQYCLPDLSKLEPADIINDDGTITKSYTNNKATCVRDVDSAGATDWVIAAYLWGSNDAKIQPTLAISGQTQGIQPEAISVVGRGNYKIDTFEQYDTTGDSQYTRAIHFSAALYVDKSVGLLGVAPIDKGSWSMAIDASSLPDGWIVAQSANTPHGKIPSMGLADDSLARSGAMSLQHDGSSITVRMSDAATAVKHCPEVPTTSGLSNDKCYYSGFDIVIGVPYASLSSSGKRYELNFGKVSASINDKEYAIDPQPSVLGWTLSAKASAQVGIWSSQDGQDLVDAVGWENWYANNQPVYDGEQFYLALMLITNIVPGREVATDLDAYVSLVSNGLYFSQPFNRNITNMAVLDSDSTVQYGVANHSAVGDSCNGMGNDSGYFFDTLESANACASQIGGKVNVVGIRANTVIAWKRDGRIGSVGVVATGGKADQVLPVTVSIDASTNEWTNKSASNTLVLTPGLLSHTLTAIPSSTNPGKEDHITISTKTYNKDTNTKITTTLPNGLGPKAGSFTITTGYGSTGTPIKEVLIEGEGQDYTIASSSDGGYTITFDLDHIASTHHVPLTGYDPIYPGESGVTNIAWNSESSSWQEVTTTNNNNTDSDLLNDDLPIAADNDGNGIDHAHTPIEFDLVVNEDAPVPSTLTINSTVTGTGTSYASTSFKTASDTIAIANPPATFGYDLTATPSSIYAGDSLTYNYSISNTTKDSASDITMVSVLPYNGDSRGTTGLKEVEENNPYTLTNLSLSLPGDGTTSGSDTSTTRLYYTLDPKVRDLESTNPEALGTDSSITWQELVLNSDGTIPPETMTELEDEGTSITALKLTSTTLPSGSKLNLEVTLDNILATAPGTQAKLASDITYLTYSTESNSINTQDANTPTILLSSDSYTVYSNGQTISTHQNPITTDYLGELLALSIPEDEQSISITTKPGTVLIGDPLVHHLSLTTGTLHGYTLTMRAQTMDGALTNKDQTRIIPTLPTKPTTTQASWSATIAGSNNPNLNNPDNPDSTYAAIPGINQTPLSLYTSTTKGRDSRSLTITYGLGTTPATTADTYTAEVVYTVTGE